MPKLLSLLVATALCALGPAALGAAGHVHPAEKHSGGHHRDDHHHGDDHHGEHHAHPELPNLIGVFIQLAGLDIHHGLGWFLHTFTLNIFTFIIVGLVSWLFIAAAAQLRERPGPLQNAVEAVIEGFYTFIAGILGPKHARRFVPFLGTLFIFIWFHNFAGMVPFFMAPTSKIQTTVALAVCVFCYVQYIALTELGPKTYLFHLAGEPQGAIMWAMSPLFLLLHLIGEIAKPLSLALRLFGNILGEDILLGSFMLMGVALMGLVGLADYVGLPLQMPFFFLSLLLGTIQAVVFTLLSTIYILMVLPHEHDHGEHNEHEAHAQPARPSH